MKIENNKNFVKVMYKEGPIWRNPTLGLDRDWFSEEEENDPRNQDTIKKILSEAVKEE